MPLSDLTVRTLRPRERAYKVYDRDGLFLLINPAAANCGVGVIASIRRKN